MEGIPLAIELAAARMGVLSAEQLAERVEDSLKLLTGGGRTAEPRHRTLRATLEWSHELLGEAERALFGRLSVFAGGWTLEAAEEVCSGEGIERGDVLDLLTELVEKSLAVAEAGEEGVPHFRMLEPVRQYARERLEGRGEGEETLRRHAGYYHAFALEAGPLLMGRDQVPWLERTWREQYNLLAAMRFLLDREDPDRAVGLTWALGRYWWVTGLQGEARRWMEGCWRATIRASLLREGRKPA